MDILGKRCMFQISGMTCSSCVHKIETDLSRRKGVVSASVALATSRASIEYDPALVGPRDLINCIEVSELNSCLNCHVRGLIKKVHGGLSTVDT